MERNIKKVGSKIEAKHYEGNNFIEKEFKIKEVLGEGRSSVVYLVEYIENEIYVKLGILKEFNPINKDEQEDEFLEAYRKQIEFISKIEAGINITTKAEGIYRTENELYILMEINKGQIYSNIAEKDLESLIKTIISISKGIDVYHKKGYVHLDIKPENILILDETRELIKLFDFDSIQKLENLRLEKLLCTRNWAAPELFYLEKSFNIGYETDIYSIGVILFNKIFNRFPNRKEQNKFSNIKFDKENNLFDGVSPRIFNMLNNFFRKTININSKLRFKNIDEMLEELDKILKISKKDNKVLVDVRWAKFEKAMGREKEKKYIHKVLEEKGTVFIKGVGGVGKSELVKMYVDEYEEKYNTIQFITFDESLKETIAKELKYTNLNEEEYFKGDDIKGLFEEKFKLLNREEKDTLIIIDNFNIDEDKDLNAFIKRKPDGYKLIFTTRNDFEDFEELYLKLETLDIEVAKKLFFELYCNRIIKDEEKKDIEEILKIIGYNTLAIKLIALNCKNQRRKPKIILEKLKDGNIQDIDGKIRHNDENKSIYEHLSTILEVIDLKKNYKLILKIMSLIGTAKISASFFKELNALEDFDEINELVYLGWLELDKERDMLYIHELISNVVNEKLKPRDVECESFIKNITIKLNEKNNVYRLRRMYFTFARKIEERIKIEGNVGGELLLTLAKEVIWRNKAKKYISKAEKVYKGDKNLKKVYLLYIEFYIEKLCNIELWGKEKKFLLKVKKYEKRYLAEYDWIEVEDYKRLRQLYVNKLSSISMFLEEEEMLDYAKNIESLFLKEEKKIKEENKELQEFYEEIQYFYGDFLNPIQSESKERLYRIKSEQEEDTEENLLELGNGARIDGDYDLALEYYNLIINRKESWLKGEAYENILEIYDEMGRYDEAISFSGKIKLLEVEMDKILYLIGKMYLKKKDKVKAQEIFIRGIEAAYKSIEEKVYSKQYHYDLIGKFYYELGNMQEDKIKALELYEKGIGYHRDRYIDGIYEKIGDIKKKDKYYIEELECIEKQWVIDGDRAISIFEKIMEKEREGYFLIGRILFKGYKYKEAREYYKEALVKEKNELIKNVYLKKIGDSYSNELETEKAFEYYKKINLLEVANFCIKNLLNEKASEEFIEIAGLYEHMDEHQNAIRSYKKALEYLNLEKNKENIMRTYEKISYQYNELKDYEKVREYKLKILNLRKKDKEIFEIAIIYMELGEIEELLKNIEKAEENYIKALERFKEKKEINYVIKALEKLCDITDSNESYEEELKNIVNYEIEI